MEREGLVWEDRFYFHWLIGNRHQFCIVSLIEGRCLNWRVVLERTWMGKSGNLLEVSDRYMSGIVEIVNLSLHFPARVLVLSNENAYFKFKTTIYIMEFTYFLSFMFKLLLFLSVNYVILQFKCYIVHSFMFHFLNIFFY